MLICRHELIIPRNVRRTGDAPGDRGRAHGVGFSLQELGGGLTMPLRDHFRPPLDDSRSWDELHGAWPTVIVMALNRNLPPRYVAAPRVHLGPHAEIDVTASTDSVRPPQNGGAMVVSDCGLGTAASDS